MKEKFIYKPGDKIFAKVKGFVYWPARVNPIPDDILVPPNKIPIFFYGTHEVYFISPSSCWPYDDKYKAKWGKPHSRAHFNEGMDEIENNPTLFQYGADPNAEDYLAQFYEFKRNDGEMSSKNIMVKNKMDNSSIDQVSQKELIKKRNTSGSSISIKENKDLNTKKSSRKSNGKTNFKEDLDKKQSLIDVDVVDTNVKIPDSEKDKIKKVENKIEAEISIHDDTEVYPKVDSENSNDGEHIPKLRSRSLSSTKKIVKRKTLKNEKSEDGSDSVSVTSDNPEDEDFKPATKSIKISKKSKVKKPILKIKEKRERKPKREKKLTLQKSNTKTSNATKSKKEKKKVMSDVDSLSSISSLDDWQEKDEKRRKEHEEMVKQAHMEEILKEEKAIKEASKQARKKSRSRSNIVDYEQKTDLAIVNDISMDENKDEISNYLNKDVANFDNVSQSQTMDKDVIMDSLDLNVVKNDIELFDKMSTILVESNVREDTISESYDKFDIPFDEHIENLTKIDQSENIITDDREQISNMDIKISKKLINKKPENKTHKKERITPKKPISSLKRRIMQSDESDDEILNKDTKKSRFTRSATNDSDYDKTIHNLIEDDVTMGDISPDVVHTKPTFDKVKALQSYNCDIRSSLVLGHEDYDKCIDRFKSLCTMDIDLVSLVTVWQLMDTVKKCRRYKRDERIMHEAQNVYKRFLNIHGQSSPDELQKSQLLLAQYRSNQNSGSKSITSMNGHSSQNQSMPTSVDDMFHQNKQPSRGGDNNRGSKVVSATVVEEPVPSVISPPSPIVVPQPVSSVELDEEKMRLLSADLEAKVSDILNKIEKNSLSNPINRQSMSHLLPARSDDNSIQLPVEWESVDSRGGSGRQSHDNDNKINDASDDDDEDDMDAIVKKIEDVPIKLPDEEDYNDNVVEMSSSSDAAPMADTEASEAGATSSALDARIENLFNSKFVSGSKEVVNVESGKTSSKRQPVTTKTIQSSSSRIPGLSVSPTPPSSEKTSPPIPPSQMINIFNDEYDHESLETAADKDIYDLLGV